MKQRYCLINVFDNIYVMPKQTQAIVEMPPVVRSLLRELGDNLAIARKRRKESVKVWAGRIGVSAPTLSRMERGDPSVAFGIYATALWMMGRAHALPELAAPQFDLGALEREVRVATARAVRKPLSIAGRIKSFAADTATTEVADAVVDAVVNITEPKTPPGPDKLPGPS
jgi:transcriptional regulator with XRE-family HTH domain